MRICSSSQVCQSNTQIQFYTRVRNINFLDPLRRNESMKSDLIMSLVKEKKRSGSLLENGRKKFVPQARGIIFKVKGGDKKIFSNMHLCLLNVPPSSVDFLLRVKMLLSLRSVSVEKE